MVGTGAAFVAKESGEALAAKVGEPQTRRDRLPWLAGCWCWLAWFFLRRPSNGGLAGRSPAAPVVGVLAAIMAVIVTAVTVLVATAAPRRYLGRRDRLDRSAVERRRAVDISHAPTVDDHDVEQGDPSSKSNSYTLADVAKHGTASSCWTAIDGNVYDVTDWITRHPGGQRPILGLCGKDGSSAFDNQHGAEPSGCRTQEALIGTLA